MNQTYFDTARLLTQVAPLQFQLFDTEPHEIPSP